MELVHVFKAEVGCQPGGWGCWLWCLRALRVLRVQQAWTSSQAKPGPPDRHVQVSAEQLSS